MKRLVFIAFAACGGGASPQPQIGGPPAAMVGVAAPDDAIVATVNGRPVFGSCVTAQSRGKTKEIAVRECIDFELMAQEAERRGLDRDAETVDATRTRLVARLVDQFAARTSAEALKSKIDELYKPELFTRPEGRGSYHVLVEPKHGVTDAAALALATKIHAALANETGLMSRHVDEIARQVAGAAALRIETIPPMSSNDTRFATEYRDALYAIADVGRVSPVIKTQFGYHVILFSETFPATKLDREAATPIIHANLQRRMFDEYLGEVLKTSGIRAQPFPEVLDRLEGK